MKQFVLFVLVAILASFGLLTVVCGGFEQLGVFVSIADPLFVLVLVSAALALCSALFGLITGDNSWVDRLWSTAPIAYAWYYAHRSGYEFHVLVAAAIVTIWGLRLTHNFARKGGYSGEEDYRWAILRKRITNPVLWQLFNLFFISAFQIALFLGFTIPLWMLFQHPTLVSESLFVAFCGIALLAIVYETIADQQQWNFHLLKKSARNGTDVSASALAIDINRGFLASGLFAHSRHPNYFGELTFWWALWLAAAFGSGTLLDISIAGPLVLTALFIGSTVFTEELTSGKYPEYKEYQNRVSPIIPWPASRSGAKVLEPKK